MSSIKVLSLFTGGGGLDIGFHRAGFDIVGCIEIDKPSCETLELNRGRYLSDGCKIINADITTLDFYDTNIGDVDFIVGGPPCQSFSAAGRRAGGVTGINDKRGSLFVHYCRALKHFKPKGFLFENVRGILQANKKDDWEYIKASFEELGYKLHFRILDAADYGAPQHRERVILVGSKEGTFLFPRPTHGPDSVSGAKYVTAGEVFADIDDPEEVVPPYGGKYGYLLPEIPPGMNYSHFTEKMGHPNPLFAWRSKFSGFLYKLDPDGLSKTVVAHQGKYDGPFHWKNRKLNLKELKRVQTFPDDYKFIESKGHQVKQIGNSVAPCLAFQLAKAVNKQFFKATVEVELLPAEYKLKFDARKGVKARKTRKKVNSYKDDQYLLLAAEPKSWPKDKYSLEVKTSDGSISFSANLSNGLLALRGPSSKTGNTSFTLTLKFNKPLNGQFKKIVVRFDGGYWGFIKVLWESIHSVIPRHSSYESLQPLYGHFTEPYPQFLTGFDYEADEQIKELEWVKMVTDYSNLSKLLPYEKLSPFLGGEETPSAFIRKMRDAGFDIRTHETNRAIPEGSFKICYPFTLHSSDMVFIKWIEKGDHHLNDIEYDSLDKMKVEVLSG